MIAHKETKKRQVDYGDNTYHGLNFNNRKVLKGDYSLDQNEREGRGNVSYTDTATSNRIEFHESIF